jgi:hypothetical protein
MSEEKAFSTNFNKSIQTLALFKESVFISAFASYIVFGVASSIGYKKESYFKLNFFDLFKFYAEIVKITVFLGTEKLADKGVFFNENTLKYCWIGKTVKKNEFSDKFVTFVIQNNDQMLFELAFTIPELNNFYDTLSRSIIPTLCLKDYEQALLYEASLLPTDLILSLKTNSVQLNLFVNDFCKRNFKRKVRTSTFKELLKYYNDILLLVNKLVLLKQETSYTPFILTPMRTC